MLSFELSAIDLILVISVVVLLILYLTKISVKKYEKITLRKPTLEMPLQKISEPIQHRDFTECPRGFGNIKKLNKDNSVSERCLGCYRLMECYSENE